MDLLRRLRPVGAHAAAALAVGMASGCADRGAAAPEPVQLDITVSADARVNLDAQGRAAPLQLRIYELKTPVAFEAADYFGLANGDRALLQTDLVSRQEWLLRPGESQRLRRAAQPEATAIGVLAGYRDLPAVRWRAVHPLPGAAQSSWTRWLTPARKVRLHVLADETGVQVKAAD
ncbi:type VI secretion system lipoprotein TssJ [Xylophilus sp. GOD-11R]|uniref:type VI secretion system lipoprotein TssJ n=1 Tax=Xylophilus sp. GOD-11R TaxID=3089814 RepID=UPI00298CE056|nr:type VI secretion system lipoprotein TssJ [Xylophilus sp. GOD-11R]WPB55365.1 type VI secretion system lipoprotein TssJ [Xylophilus sp. GOD-11R]